MNRRNFLKTGIKEYFKILAASTSLKCAPEDNENYFSSVFSCYPLLSEAPYDQLVDAAIQLGLNPENKSKFELAREIFTERR